MAAYSPPTPPSRRTLRQLGDGEVDIPMDRADRDHPPRQLERDHPPAVATAVDRRTLGDALRETAMHRWRDRRCEATNIGQALLAIKDLGGAKVQLRHVTRAKLLEAVGKWQGRDKLTPASVNKRLNCLSAMGVNVRGCRAHNPKKLKWWLNPQDHERFRALLPPGDLLMSYIDWTAATGLRVEETLRLCRSDFSDGFREVLVPGTKASEAQATIPLSTAAQIIARSLLLDATDHNARMFPVSYVALRKAWRKAAKALDITHPGATLKALRRSAARHLTTNGMPLDVLRQYLRHSDISTTIEYLRLTGGYNTEEIRKWLPK